MEPKKNEYSNLLFGVAIGLIASIVGNYFLVQFQNSSTKEQMKMQLVLDEKKLFVEGCNNFLSQYRDWHELMNYYVYLNKEGGPNYYINEFDSISAVKKCVKWKREFDLSYGYILLLSKDKFGYSTMEVSTRLHNALNSVMHDDTLSQTFKEQILFETDKYFYDTWLSSALAEIELFNSGNRIKTIE